MKDEHNQLKHFIEFKIKICLSVFSVSKKVWIPMHAYGIDFKKSKNGLGELKVYQDSHNQIFILFLVLYASKMLKPLVNDLIFGFN